MSSDKKVTINFFSGKTDNVFLQLVRYFFVGTAAFCVDYGLLFLLTEYVGFYHLISATISFCLGLLVNYVISIAWVFTSNKTHDRVKEFIIFSIIGIIGLILNWIIIYVGTDIFQIHYLLSKLCSTIVVFFWNFFARKIILF